MRLHNEWSLAVTVKRVIPVAIASVAVVIAFTAGFLTGSRYLGAKMTAGRRLSVELQEQKAQIAEGAAEVTSLRTARDVDRQAMEYLRKSVAALDKQLSGQRAELMLYRKLLKSDNIEDGLHILDASITAREEKFSFDYSFVIRQKAALLKTISVDYSVQVLGQQDGKPISYPLADLDDAVVATLIKTKLKYFQVIEGVLQLPENFVAQSVLVSAWPTGAPTKRVEQTFDWPISVE